MPITATECITFSQIKTAILVNYSRKRGRDLHQYLQIAWQELVRCNTCHIADLHSVGNQFESWYWNC